MADATQAVAPANIAHALCDDRTFVEAIELAVAGLGAEADCEHLTGGVQVLLVELSRRLEARADQARRPSEAKAALVE
jgi:hypothetical protein